MFNFRSTEDCDQDDLLNEFFNDLNNGILNDDENNDLIENDVSKKEKSNYNLSKDLSNYGLSNDTSNIDSSTSELSRNQINELNNESDPMNLKANELIQLIDDNDEDNQYFDKLINDQLILNSKDFVSFANQNLHEFLLFDKDRIDLSMSSTTTKRKLENKQKFCDNSVNNCTSSTTNNNLTSTTGNNSSAINTTPNKTQQINNSPQQLNILNFKSLVFDRSKRKLIKLLLKLKEEEKNENNDLNGIQIRKDCQLLSRYIKEEKLSYLILKLYAQNQGYSISLKKVYDKNLSKNSTITSNIKVLETIQLPYEETELLDYIDNEQIPPMLLDVLDSNCDSDEHLDLFHFGKLFVEIQDYRKNANVNSSNQNYESKFVLLKPTAQTILNDVEKLTTFNLNNLNACQNWSDNDKLELESKLVLATSDPICLDPNPLTFLSSNQLNYEMKWLNNDRIKKVCRKSSQIYQNQIEKFNELPAPKHLELFDFIKKKYNNKHVDISTCKVNKRINDHIFIKEKSLNAPKSYFDDVKKYSKTIEIPIRNDNSLTKLEEYVMEYTEQSQRAFTTTSISIFYRQVDDTYFGQLNVEKNSKLYNNLSNQSGGSSCLFKLGNKILTKKYIEQFIEILSEHGRKCIKITTRKPGEPPRINYTKKLFNNANLNANLNTNLNPNNNPVDNSIPIKKIKVENSNGSMVNLNQNFNSSPNEYTNLSSSLNSPVQSISLTNMNSSSNSSLNQQLKPTVQQQCIIKPEINQQHPILSNNLMHSSNNQTADNQSIGNINNNSNNHYLNHSNSTSSSLSTTPELVIPSKSPYAQMSILEKNSNQIQLQQIQQQNQQQIQPQSNNLIANNPILNNLITNNTISTNLVQNNFIQLNTKNAKNINISNGYINETIALTNQDNNQNPINNQTYIDSTNLNPITISPITSLNNKLNSGKSETAVAVILTTNPLSNSTFISNNSAVKTNSMSPSIIQITSSGQTTTSTTTLATGVNLGRGQNLRLHNLVSLTNVGTNQCIALPISLMMAPSTATNAQTLNANGNAIHGNDLCNVVVGCGLDTTAKDHSNQQNVVLINNLDHHHPNNQPQQITYQTSQLQHYSIGTIGGLNNCRLTTTNQNLHHTNLQTIPTIQNSFQANLPTNLHIDQLDSSNLKKSQHFTAYNPQGPTALTETFKTKTTLCSTETQQLTIGGSQVQLTKK